jgi:tetratricopeptide (TPR) repeat protein
MTASLIRLARQHEEALVDAGVAALREVEDDTFDSDIEIELSSQDGFPVDVTERVEEPAVRERRRACAKAAFDLLLGRLRRGAITRRALLALRDAHGEDALLVALSEIADTLGRLQSDGEANAEDHLAVHRARADARALLQSPHDLRGVDTAEAAHKADNDNDNDNDNDSDNEQEDLEQDNEHDDEHDDDRDDEHERNHDDGDAGDERGVRATPAAISHDGGRGAPSTLGQDLASFAEQGRSTTRELDASEARRSPTTLLRLRATTLDAARRLLNVSLEPGLTRCSASPDELIVTAGGHDAVDALVRTTSMCAAGLGEGSGFSAAIVAADDDVVDAVIRAAERMPASHADCLVSLDEPSRAAAAELADLAGRPGVVDARAPWGHERWELSASLGRPAFRDRDEEVAACVEVLGRGGEDPRLLVLGGPAGIGKSSLLRQALREAGLLDERAALMWGAADPLQPTPWAPLVGMVRALARAPAGHPRAAERIARMIDGLAALLVEGDRREFAPRRGSNPSLLHRPEADELLALGPTLKELMGVADTDEPEPDERRNPRALRTALRRCVVLIAKALLLRAGDDRPLVVVVSGAEAIDAPTREALIFLGRRLGPRLRLVLLTNASKWKVPPSFEESFAVTRRDVRPLGEQASRAIAAELLDVDVDVGVEVGDGELRRLLAIIAARARGSPLYAAHATRWAVEAGAISRPASGVGWTALRVDEVGPRLPTRLDRLLAARVQRLPSAPRRVLGHCAALGSTFMPTAVDFVGTRLGLSADEVRQAIRLLTETGFLTRSQRRPGAPLFVDDAVSDDTLLVFEHPLLRAAAEQALSDDEARAVHGVVADALETLHDPRAVAASLARHHALADRRRRAVHHLVSAVRRARRLDDRHSAVAMATEALELIDYDQTDLAFTLRLELAAALESGAAQGDKAQATLKEALKQLVRAADATGRPSRQSIALSRVARFNLFLGDFDKAEHAALRSLELARSGRDDDGEEAPRRIRDVLRLLALIRFATRDLDGAKRALEEARRLTPERERHVRSGIAHHMGLLHLESNDPLGALERFLEAIVLTRATTDLAGEAACLDAIADVYVRTGHLWTALSLLVRAISLREAIGDDAATAQSLKNRAEVLLMAGDVAAAVDEASRARARCRVLGLERLERQCAVVVARAELARRDAAAAEGIIDAVRRRVDVERDPFAAMETELLSARAKWLRAQQAHGGARERLLKSALQRARAAVELGERRGFLSGQVLGNALVGELLLAGGDVAAALPHAQRAAELLDDRSATGLAVEDALLPYIKTLRALGDDDEASGVESRARALLEERAARLPAAVRQVFWALPSRQPLRPDVNGL